jgi:uncharacterized protein DUF1259
MISRAWPVLACLLASLGVPAQAAIDWSAVDKAIGRSGQEQAGGVHRYNFPRSDLKVTLDGVAIKPALALGSWAAFLPDGDQTMVMGDLVLTHQEVNPVLSRLLAGGMTITALHNHLLRSTPATMYMHINGHGDPVKLASALAGALATTRTPPPQPSASPPPVTGFDTAAVERALGATGKPNGGVLQFSFPRMDQVTENGMAMPSSMGLGTAINFEPTSAGRAAISGDFVLVGSEVDPVLRALRAGGIEVTALHNHMIGEEPRLFFMHFWANADAVQLARTLRSALDKMKIKPS